MSGMNGMTWDQVQWASKHDWFVRMNESCNGVSYTVTVRHDVVEGEELVFTEFVELRAWAGY